MASSTAFIDYFMDQVSALDGVTCRKMFGEYAVYLNQRVVALICDDTVYVKQVPAASNVFAAFGLAPDTSVPYAGARPHFVVDVENAELLVELLRQLSHALPLPKKKQGRR